MLLVSPPGVSVAVVVSSAGVVNSAVAVVMVGDCTLVVGEAVGVTDGDVKRELVLSAEAEVAGVVVIESLVLPVMYVVRFVSGVECEVELLGIVASFCCISPLLAADPAGPKVVVSAEEKASRQHARVAKAAAMVLL